MKRASWELLETCFDVCCQHGLENTSLLMLSKACGLTNATLLHYFPSKDAIIIQATAHCMAKVEDDFMARAPRSFEDIERFLREMPAVTARLHGAKYRLCTRCTPAPSSGNRARTFSGA